MQDRSTQIRAFSSEQRLEILRLLKTPEVHFAGQWSADPAEFGVCMMLIAEALGVAQPTASRHVDLLRQAGFITVHRKGKWVYCRRQEEALGDFLAWISETLGTDAPSA
ncbi:ArsR/SmtB family transcription factor [Stappia sp.]|uniref:ArsR/SmtB family transcription factor n=1 Tax=Stappia sp. TaxID=1870903 RepID=UPI003A993174